MLPGLGTDSQSPDSHSRIYWGLCKKIFQNYKGQLGLNPWRCTIGRKYLKSPHMHRESRLRPHEFRGVCPAGSVFTMGNPALRSCFSFLFTNSIMKKENRLIFVITDTSSINVACISFLYELHNPNSLISQDKYIKDNTVLRHNVSVSAYINGFR